MLSKVLILPFVFFHMMQIVYAQGISLSSTRVIFNESEVGAVITIRNNSEIPWLIRAKALLSPDDSQDAPFIVTPPLFRVESENRNTVRILSADTTNLPRDRESIFYLSFLAIPSSGKSEEMANSDVSAQVTMGINTIIKLFYRPNALINKEKNIPDKLIFSYKNKAIIINNPTAYYQTLAYLKINKQQIPIQETGAMIAPFSIKKFKTPQDSASPEFIYWAVIDDLGVVSEQRKVPVN